MTDVKKVIKGLEHCREGNSCDGCPCDIGSSKCIFQLHDDILSLLKEQDQRVLELVTEKDRLAEELHKLIQHCDNIDVDALLGRKVVDIRKDVPGLWCDDITFCQEKCDWKDCPRNSKNIRDRKIPHSYFADTPDDCPKRLGGR